MGQCAGLSQRGCQNYHWSLITTRLLCSTKICTWVLGSSLIEPQIWPPGVQLLISGHLLPLVTSGQVVQEMRGGGGDTSQLHLQTTQGRLHCYIKLWQALCWSGSYWTFSAQLWDHDTDHARQTKISTLTRQSSHSTNHQYIISSTTFGDGTKFFLCVFLIIRNVQLKLFVTHILSSSSSWSMWN